MLTSLSQLNAEMVNWCRIVAAYLQIAEIEESLL